ncbi:hypothetical protein JM78_04595 [Burkholderia pyrrocinia]|uniref:hypothetical protein n=1 Tax=Burkholderia pyrrocinia TaxID=60550 RepID=UPI000501AF42|nr:hypothetical protein [Burkholderia pyrrocinia]KFL54383.1 hypothetical protein JM78_04595 [Burkholderia pyrrocinia]
MIQSYDIQIPAGGTQLLEVGAQIFDFLSSGSAFDTIQVLPEFQQGNVTLKLGQGFDAGQVVNRWFVKNPGPTAINGTVVLSTAGFRNFRISGDVNVLDGGKSRTMANSAYGGYGQQPAVAAQYSRIQLWNPATNTNRLVLEQLAVYAGSLSTMALESSTAQLANFVDFGQAKLLGGTASVAGCYSDTTVTVPPTNMMIGGYPVAAGILQNIPLREPIVIRPGYGLIVGCQTVNNGTTASFEWYEEPNT